MYIKNLLIKNLLDCCRTGGKHSDVGVIGLATATPEEAEEYDSSRRWGLPRELVCFATNPAPMVVSATTVH